MFSGFSSLSGWMFQSSASSSASSSRGESNSGLGWVKQRVQKIANWGLKTLTTHIDPHREWLENVVEDYRLSGQSLGETLEQLDQMGESEEPQERPGPSSRKRGRDEEEEDVEGSSTKRRKTESSETAAQPRPILRSKRRGHKDLDVEPLVQKSRKEQEKEARAKARLLRRVFSPKGREEIHSLDPKKLFSLLGFLQQTHDFPKNSLLVDRLGHSVWSLKKESASEGKEKVLDWIQKAPKYFCPEARVYAKHYLSPVEYEEYLRVSILKNELSINPPSMNNFCAMDPEVFSFLVKTIVKEGEKEAKSGIVSGSFARRLLGQMENGHVIMTSKQYYQLLKVFLEYSEVAANSLKEKEQLKGVVLVSEKGDDFSENDFPVTLLQEFYRGNQWEEVSEQMRHLFYQLIVHGSDHAFSTLYLWQQEMTEEQKAKLPCLASLETEKDLMRILDGWNRQAECEFFVRDRQHFARVGQKAELLVSVLKTYEERRGALSEKVWEDVLLMKAQSDKSVQESLHQGFKQLGGYEQAVFKAWSLEKMVSLKENSLVAYATDLGLSQKQVREIGILHPEIFRCSSVEMLKEVVRAYSFNIHSILNTAGDKMPMQDELETLLKQWESTEQSPGLVKNMSLGEVLRVVKAAITNFFETEFQVDKSHLTKKFIPQRVLSFPESVPEYKTGQIKALAEIYGFDAHAIEEKEKFLYRILYEGGDYVAISKEPEKRAAELGTLKLALSRWIYKLEQIHAAGAEDAKDYITPSLKEILNVIPPAAEGEVSLCYTGWMQNLDLQLSCLYTSDSTEVPTLQDRCLERVKQYREGIFYEICTQENVYKPLGRVAAGMELHWFQQMRHKYASLFGLDGSPEDYFDPSLLPEEEKVLQLFDQKYRPFVLFQTLYETFGKKEQSDEKESVKLESMVDLLFDQEEEGRIRKQAERAYQREKIGACLVVEEAEVKAIKDLVASVPIDEFALWIKSHSSDQTFMEKVLKVPAVCPRQITMSRKKAGALTFMEQKQLENALITFFSEVHEKYEKAEKKSSYHMFVEQTLLRKTRKTKLVGKDFSITDQQLEEVEASPGKLKELYVETVVREKRGEIKGGLYLSDFEGRYSLVQGKPLISFSVMPGFALKVGVVQKNSKKRKRDRTDEEDEERREVKRSRTTGGTELEG